MLNSNSNAVELLKAPRLKDLFGELYGTDNKTIDMQVNRYRNLIDTFKNKFNDLGESIQLFSTSGRTEVGGNHTDHNAGRVLAAAVSLDSIAAARKTTTNVITIFSKGYDKPFIVDLGILTPQENEQETTNAIIRGIAARFAELAYQIGGFDAYIDSDVMRGSGLSSSASIEVLLGTIMSVLYNDGKVDPEVLAVVGQYAENKYFNKPCGLMDQMACAVGGFVTIDFKDADHPIVKKVDFDFASKGYSLLVVDTGGNHADLTQDYADVPKEMKGVAQQLGGSVCREISIDQVIENIPSLREEQGDRAILRALHFFHDNQRVKDEVTALEEDRFQDFLDMVIASGSSSWRWLQNCYTTQNPLEQGVTLALAVTENYMSNNCNGAYRVHGGGFAGTIQVFMPNDHLWDYLKLMENIFGDNSVTVLNIRPHGTLHINSILEK